MRKTAIVPWSQMDFIHILSLRASHGETFTKSVGLLLHVYTFHSHRVSAIGLSAALAISSTTVNELILS